MSRSEVCKSCLEMTNDHWTGAKAADVCADVDCYLLVAGESEQRRKRLTPGGL